MTGKQILGVGDACNRAEKAVERTVPFGFLIQSLLIVWYARQADSTSDIGWRRRSCPWYRTKTSPSPADMLARLRREFTKAGIPARQKIVVDAGPAVDPVHHRGVICCLIWAGAGRRAALLRLVGTWPREAGRRRAPLIFAAVPLDQAAAWKWHVVGMDEQALVSCPVQDSPSAEH